MNTAALESAQAGLMAADAALERATAARKAAEQALAAFCPIQPGDQHSFDDTLSTGKVVRRSVRVVRVFVFTKALSGRWAWVVDGVSAGGLRTYRNVIDMPQPEPEPAPAPVVDARWTTTT